MKHVGVRPQNFPLIKDERITKRAREIYYENLPDGGYRIWNNKLLKSGCGLVIDDVKVDEQGLIFCSHCEEWCNSNQFIKGDGE